MTKIKNTVQAIPQAAGLIRSMSRTGYSYYEAICELVDNSIDATKHLTKDNPRINVKIIGDENGHGFASRQTPSKVVVSDNGVGMSEQEALKALGFGSSDNKDATVDLGTFGMGLKTSALAIGSKITLITKKHNHPLAVVICDWEEMVERNDFAVNSLSVRPIHRNIFKKFTDNAESGCVVIIDGLTKSCFPKRLSYTYKTLSSTMRRVYRFLIKKNPDLQISVSDLPPLTAADIVKHSNPDLTTFYKGSANFGFDWHEYTDGSKVGLRLSKTSTKAGVGRLPASECPMFGSGIRGAGRQGVYYIRNDREIAIAGAEFWLHRSFLSNFYLELAFEDDGRFGDDSQPIRTDFGKKSVVLDPEFRTWVSKLVKPGYELALSSIKDNTKEENKQSLEEHFADIVPDLQQHVERVRQRPAKDIDPAVVSIADLVDKQKEKENKKRKNSKYVGAAVNLGHSSENQFIYPEIRSWPGPVPFALEPTDSGDFLVVLNQSHSFVDKVINSLDTEVGRERLRTISTTAIAAFFTIDDQEERDTHLSQWGKLIDSWPDTYGTHEEEDEEDINVDMEALG